MPKWVPDHFLYHNLMSCVPLIKECLFWSIGNVSHTKILSDKWIPKPTNYRVQAPMHLLNKDAYVRELIDSNSPTWNTKLIN